MKTYAGEMSEEEMATERWENEGGHTTYKGLKGTGGLKH